MTDIIIVPVTGLDPSPRAAALFGQWAEVYAASARDALGESHDAWSETELRELERDAHEAAQGSQSRHRVAALIDERVVGAGEVILPLHDNTFQAEVYLAVLPDDRRRGVGTALLSWARGIARAAGRRTLSTSTVLVPGGSDPGEAFARRAGFEVTQVILRSDAPVARGGTKGMAPTGTGEPERHPSGYRIASAVDRLPMEWLVGRAHLRRRMSTDTPWGDTEHEEELWDAARVEAEDSRALAMGRRIVESVAAHAETGELVGFTRIEVSAATPERGYQHDTLVLQEHRGHGLGRALKMSNAAALQQACPDVQYIRTWNAAENTPMLDVNRTLGFTVTAHLRDWQAPLD